MRKEYIIERAAGVHPFVSTLYLVNHKKKLLQKCTQKCDIFSDTKSVQYSRVAPHHTRIYFNGSSRGKYFAVIKLLREK